MSLSKTDIQECLQTDAAINWLKQTPIFHSIFCCFLKHYSCTSSQSKSKLTSSAVQRWKRKTPHCLSLWTCQAPFPTCPSAFQTGFQVEIYLWQTGLIKILLPLLDCVVPFQKINFMKHAWNQILSLQINKMVFTISFYTFYHLLKCWK